MFASGVGCLGTMGENVGDGHGAIDKFVADIPDLALAPVQGKTELSCEGDICPTASQEGDSYCTYRRYAETTHFDKFVALQPNSATLWPGAVVRGKDAEEGLLTPVGVDLAPVAFSVSLENLVNSPVGRMEKPSLSTFREARNDILEGGVTGATPAALAFNIAEVNNESQLGTAIGASVSWPGGPEIGASFEFGTDNKKTKILVDFTQAYYTIDVDSPKTPKEFFAPSVTAADLAADSDSSSPPLYVQSITYGRRVLFSIESEASAQNIKAALEAAYKVVGIGVGAELSVEHKTLLDSSTIKAFVIGGSGGEAAGIINGVDGLFSYIKNGGDYSKDSPGAPIAYKLAYLDNSVTKLAFTSDYTERDCVKNKGTLRAELVSIKHTGGDDAGGNLEFFGSVTVRHPTVESGVVSCAEGGAEADVWRLEDGQWLSFPEWSTWTPSAPIYVDVNDMPADPKQMLCLKASLREEDGSTNEVSGDDNYGTAELLLPFANDWTGKHALTLHGSGDASAEVTVQLSLE